MEINKSIFDICLFLTGIILLLVVNFFLVFGKKANKMITLRVFACFSLVSSVLLFFLLTGGKTQEFTKTYFLVQAFSYLIEMAMCIELAEMVIKNNWVILLIFGPTLSALMIFFIIRYSLPVKLTDVLYPGYTASTLCGFILFVIWIIEGRFDGKLKNPYSKIATSIGVYICIRFIVMLTNNYYGSSYWKLIGRLYPINEIAFLLLLMHSILQETKIIEFPTKMVIHDLAAVCRNCGEEYPDHKKGCKFHATLKTMPIR